MSKNNQPNYYAIIPASVRYDNELTDKAKLLYGEITALSDKNGYCYATNAYFAKLYGVHPDTISRTVTQLVRRGHVKIKIYRNSDTKEVEQRRLSPIGKNAVRGIGKYADKNTTRDNNNRKGKNSKNKWVMIPDLQPGQRVIITVVNDND